MFLLYLYQNSKSRQAAITFNHFKQQQVLLPVPSMRFECLPKLTYLMVLLTRQKQPYTDVQQIVALKIIENSQKTPAVD